MPANLSRLAILSIFRDRDVPRPYPLHFTEISQAMMSSLSSAVFASSADRSSTLMRCIGEQRRRTQAGREHDSESCHYPLQY